MSVLGLPPGVSFDDPTKGMTEIELATKDTPKALRDALAEEAKKREAAEGRAPVHGAERRGGIFGWLKRG